MSNRNGLILATILFIVLVIGFLMLFLIPSRTTEPADIGNTPPTASTTPTDTATTEPGRNGSVAELDNLIEVTMPLIGARISSPLKITGQARGAWYFEASAPVELRDASGKVVAQGHITAGGDWMTEEFVPFTATLTFTKQVASTTGTLVLKNDNPSGDPARQKELLIPITF